MELLAITNSTVCNVQQIAQTWNVENRARYWARKAWFHIYMCQKSL